MNFDYLPELNLSVLKSQHISRDHYPNEIIDILQAEQYTDLGWRNAGIKIPEGAEFTQQYQNYSGSYTIMVNHEFRMYYCVDMGD